MMRRSYKQILGIRLGDSAEKMWFLFVMRRLISDFRADAHVEYVKHFKSYILYFTACLHSRGLILF